MTEQLIFLTRKLLSYSEELDKRFELAKTEGKEPDFYSEVKPFAEEVKKWNDEWLVTATKWLEVNAPKYLHSNQVKSAHEHMEQLSIQAFYPGTSRKRFKDSIRTAEYVLKGILQQGQ